MANSLTGRLYGAAQLALFMQAGLDAFSDDKKTALRTLIIPVLCALPGLFYAVHFPAADLEAAPASDIVLIGLARLVISFPIGVFLVYYISGWIDRQQYFWHWLHASNWISAIFFIVFGVPKLLVASGAFTKCYMYQYSVFLEIYAYAVSGYLFYRAFRINALLAVGLACFMLLINHEIGRLMFSVFGYGFDPRGGECPPG